ncbi:MAG: hypothetical protein JXR96_13130 [Deltaproteobacteria bacterium]|nr:hypothetical protein [Deltaproteobacteria bacterium]
MLVGLLAAPAGPETPGPRWLAYATRGKTSAICLRNLVTGKENTVRRVERPGQGFDCLQWTADGSRLVFFSRPDIDSTEVVSFDPATGRQTVTRLGPEMEGVECSGSIIDPAGRYLAVVDRGGPALRVIRLGRGEQVLERALPGECCEDDGGGLVWLPGKADGLMVWCREQVRIIGLKGEQRVLRTESPIRSILGWVPGRRRYLVARADGSGAPAFFDPRTAGLEPIAAPAGFWARYTVRAIDRAGRVLVLEQGTDEKTRFLTWRIGSTRPEPWFAMRYTEIPTLAPRVHSGTVALVVKGSTFLMPGGDIHVARVGERLGQAVARARRPSLRETVTCHSPVLRPAGP